MVNPRYKIDLKSKSRNEFFLIHGYSGSPTDFCELPSFLHKQFKANVKCDILPGHCTDLEDLNKFNLKDFIENVENSLKKEIKSGKKIVLVGISFGAQLALYLASKYPVKGLILCSITHILKFPFNIPGIDILKHIKKNLKKNYHSNELELRKKAFYYESIPTKSITMTKELRKLGDSRLKKINVPILFVHSRKEHLGNYTSVDYISNRVTSKIKDKYILNMPNHNLFY